MIWKVEEQLKNKKEGHPAEGTEKGTSLARANILKRSSKA
jgi:hypothetical protein